MFMDIVRTRKSVRAYDRRPVPDDVIRSIIETARLAPSAKNLQEWKFVVVRDDQTKTALVDVAKGQTFVKEAAAVIAGVATYTTYTMTNGVPACHVDLAIAMEHIALAAAERGIGTCWIGAFYQERARDILGIPDDCTVVALMTLGYPKDGLDPEEKNRKPLDAIICQERYE
jgi:nitroreductase